MKTKFFHFRQNNSGGGFVHDAKAGIGVHVIIEATNSQQANRIAQDIGIYFNGCESGRDCSCCGDRWHETYEDDSHDEPKIYGEPLENYDDDDYWVHYLNGEISTSRKNRVKKAKRKS